MSKVLLVLIFYILAFRVLSQDDYSNISSFRLSPLLMKRAQRLERTFQPNRKNQQERINEEIIQKKLFGKSYVKEKRSISELGEQNPLFQRIYDEIIKEKPSQLGQLLSGNILKYNQEFDLGETNYSGFKWQKPMGNFSIYLDRNISENLLEDGHFIVADIFSIVGSLGLTNPLLFQNSLYFFRPIHWKMRVSLI